MPFVVDADKIASLNNKNMLGVADPNVAQCNKNVAPRQNNRGKRRAIREAQVLTFDDILKDKGYPGFDPVKHIDAPWATDQLKLFKPEDAERFWFMGFQWPRAYPLNFVWLEDGFAWGTQAAAHNLPLPPSDGLAPRVAGIHVYGSDVPVTEHVMGARGARVMKTLPAFLDNFPAIWDEKRNEIVETITHFEKADLEGKSLSELWLHMRNVRAMHKRWWEIHFDLMYPLTANYLGFYGLCGELGIDRGDVPKFLQGYETQPMKSDRKLWELANEARGTEAGRLITSTEPKAIYKTLKASMQAAGWVKKFDDFLVDFGNRQDRVVDVTSPSWIEDPSGPLGTIKSMLQSNEAYNFDESMKAAVDEREALIAKARAKLTKQECAAFDQALATCQKANFGWWNDDHNWYIDMRSVIPIRKTAQAIARTLDMADPFDINFLFYSEIRDICSGKEKIGSLSTLIKDRKDYFDHWDKLRTQMPKVLGKPPEAIIDPVLIEIFGITDDFLRIMKEGNTNTKSLTGMPASAGTAKGIARVLRSADEIHRLNDGDILVCEGTTPTWTAAFTKIAACVCDGGGTLTHASVVSREYRVPCVVGAGLATQVIKDGDIITVDGTKGIITIHG